MQSPFLDSVRRIIRTLHYSIRTEQAYIYWIKLFILFHKKRYPEEMTVGVTGSQGRLYHDDLHACAEPWRLWSAQPTG